MNFLDEKMAEYQLTVSPAIVLTDETVETTAKRYANFCLSSARQKLSFLGVANLSAYLPAIAGSTSSTSTSSNSSSSTTTVGSHVLRPTVYLPQDNSRNNNKALN